MTQALILSQDSQRLIADTAGKDEERAHAKAKKSLWWSLGGFAASLAVAAVFPPAALPGVVSLVASVVGIIAGAHAVGHYADKKMLGSIKKDCAKEGFADKMKSRAVRLGNVFRRAGKVSDYGLYGALGFAAVALLAPPAAPVAWGLYSAAIYVLGGATLLSIFTGDAAKSADKMNIATQTVAARDTLAETLKVSNQNKPPALSASPSPGKSFDKAVNGAAPAADAAPVKTPPAPKP
jgi:hypothetical protein